MRNFFRILMIILLIYVPIVGASGIRTETDNMIARVESEGNELNSALTNFNSYLTNNKSQVIASLDVDTMEDISKYLQNSDYNNAFALLEESVNDSNLTSIGMASKINNYFTFKQDLISFVRTNQATLNIDTGTNEGIECAFDLFTKIKETFNSSKSNLSDTIDLIGSIFVGVMNRELNSKNNIKNSEIEGLIDEYKELGSLFTANVTKYTNSLDAYEEVFVILGGSEGIFDVTIKKKFREDLTRVLNNMESSLQETIDSFVSNRWNKLENYVTELKESDKTVQEKNEDITDKIDQITRVNDKFVSAINEIIGDLDIESIKTKINSILERGTTEFSNAKEYLRDNLIIGDYDIELVQNHDGDVDIDRAKEILILDKLFSIEEFKRQIELANNLGTLVFDLGNYSRVPNGAIVRVTDEDETQKEYRVIVKGDVNGNASLTITDAIEAAYYSLNAKELDQYAQMAADINNSNSVTITDVYLIAKAALEQGGNI